MNSINATLNQFDRHRKWMLLIILSVLYFLIRPYVLSLTYESNEKEQAALREQQRNLASRLDQWHEDANTASDVGMTIPFAEIERLLAVQKKENIEALIETYSDLARFHKMTYFFSQAQQWSGSGGFIGIHGINKSDLKIDAEAPHDGDVMDFINSLAKLPGKMSLLALTITRLPSTSAPNAILEYNVHMKAELTWLHNAEESDAP